MHQCYGLAEAPVQQHHGAHWAVDVECFVIEHKSLLTLVTETTQVLHLFLGTEILTKAHQLLCAGFPMREA